MATREVRVCDVFGTTRHVKTYRLLLIELGEMSRRDVTIHTINVDLCPKGLKRCMHFNNRGTLPIAVLNPKNENSDVSDQQMLPVGEQEPIPC